MSESCHLEWMPLIRGPWGERLEWAWARLAWDVLSPSGNSSESALAVLMCQAQLTQRWERNRIHLISMCDITSSCLSVRKKSWAHVVDIPYPSRHVPVDQALKEAEPVPTRQFLVRCPCDSTAPCTCLGKEWTCLSHPHQSMSFCPSSNSLKERTNFFYLWTRYLQGPGDIFWEWEEPNQTSHLSLMVWPVWKKAMLSPFDFLQGKHISLNSVKHILQTFLHITTLTHPLWVCSRRGIGACRLLESSVGLNILQYLPSIFKPWFFLFCFFSHIWSIILASYLLLREGRL